MIKIGISNIHHPDLPSSGIAGISDTLYAEPPQPLQPAGQRPALEDAWLFFGWKGRVLMKWDEHDLAGTIRIIVDTDIPATYGQHEPKWGQEFKKWNYKC